MINEEMLHIYMTSKRLNILHAMNINRHGIIRLCVRSRPLRKTANKPAESIQNLLLRINACVRIRSSIESIYTNEASFHFDHLRCHGQLGSSTRLHRCDVGSCLLSHNECEVRDGRA